MPYLCLAPVGNVKEAMQPLNRIRKIIGILRKRCIDVRDQVIGREEFSTPKPHGDHAKDLINDNVGVADIEKENTDVLDLYEHEQEHGELEHEHEHEHEHNYT